jgi:hypothetical protein
MLLTQRESNFGEYGRVLGLCRLRLAHPIVPYIGVAIGAGRVGSWPVGVRSRLMMVRDV